MSEKVPTSCSVISAQHLISDFVLYEFSITDDLVPPETKIEVCDDLLQVVANCQPEQ